MIETSAVSPYRSLRRKWQRLLTGLFAIALPMLAAWFWMKAPPDAVRLLPECDAVVYANLKPLRAITHLDRAPVLRAADYQAFIDATGIVPERDLDAVALALHHMNDPQGPNGPVAYSEIFVGRFDEKRLETYLAAIAITQEVYAGKTIFTIPVGELAGPGGRQLRVGVPARGLIAASNAPTTEQIHAMLDRGRRGPSVLVTRYGDVPWLSSAWGVGRLGLPFAEAGWITASGLRLPVREDAEFIASVRYLGGNLKLRVEELAGSELNATQTAQELAPLLTLVRGFAEDQAVPASHATRTAIDSLALKARKDRVALTGNLPVELLRQLLVPQSVQAPR